MSALCWHNVPAYYALNYAGTFDGGLDEILQLILSILEFEGAHKGCGILLLLKLVIMIVVLCGIFLKPPFQSNIYV